MSLRPSEQAELRRSSFKALVSAADGLRRRVRRHGQPPQGEPWERSPRKRCSKAVPHAQLLSPALDKMLGNLTQLAARL